MNKILIVGLLFFASVSQADKRSVDACVQQKTKEVMDSLNAVQAVWQDHHSDGIKEECASKSAN